MKSRYFFTVLFCLLLSSFNASADPPPDSGKSDKPTLTTKNTDLNAVRLSVANGVIEYVNNSKRAVIDLEWELLPLDKTLQEMATAYSVRPVHVRIPNNDLGDPKRLQNDIAKIPAAKEAFERAANIDLEFGPKSDQMKQWIQSDVAVFPLKSAQYFGLLRDNLQVSGLLSTAGINYSLAFKGALPRGENPRQSRDGKDINWEIDIYKFPISDKLNYYRFTVKAKVDRFELLFPNATQPVSNMDVVISFRQNQATIGLLEPNLRSIPAGIDIQLAPAVEKTLTQLADQHSASDLETNLNLLGGGAQLGEIVAKGLLGGTSDASVIAGGIIGQGKVSQVIGVNQEFAHLGPATIGALLGIEPGGDSSLFFGPSIRLSIFTLAVGLRTFEKTNSITLEKNATSRFAGVLSMDLSRLSGSKTTVSKVQLDNSVSGGDWGKASDLIARDLALVHITIKAEAADADKSWSLIQIKDGHGNMITDDTKRARLDFKAGMDNITPLRFVPSGEYEYQLAGIPDNFELRSSVPLHDKGTVILKGVGIIPLHWKLEHKKPN